MPLRSIASTLFAAALAAPAVAAAVTLTNGGTIGPQAATTCTQPLPVAHSSLPASQVQHLGVHTVGDIVSFNVASGTGTISIAEQGANGPPQTIAYGAQATAIPNSAVASRIKTPSGTILFDDTATEPADLSTAHVVGDAISAGSGFVTLPNTSQAFTDSAGGYPAGTWSFQVNDYAYECLTMPACQASGSGTSQYDVTVITKPVMASTGTIDIAIYLATAAFTSASAVASPSFQRFAQTFAMIYGQVGISIGTFTVYDLPAWAKASYASIDISDTGPCSEFGQMMSLSLPANTLDIFFVDSIIADNGGGHSVVIGLDGSIPGPASFGGTVSSGAIVNASDLTSGPCTSLHFGKCGADRLAFVAAHEGGHFLGLYHTTESGGDRWDPLNDTPQCTCSSACLTAAQAAQCTAGTFAMPASSCLGRHPQCGGGDDLMFWLFDSTLSSGVLSTQQGQVMRANPVVH